MFKGYKTVQNLLAGQAPLTAGAPIVSGRSVLALRAQAITLYESAIQIASQCNPGTLTSFNLCSCTHNGQSAMADRNGWKQRHLRLDTIIDNFLAALPPVDSVAGSDNKDRVSGVLSIHAFARAATIELDAGLQGLNPGRNGKDLAAARAIALSILRLGVKEMRFLEPSLAVRTTLTSFFFNLI